MGIVAGNAIARCRWSMNKWERSLVGVTVEAEAGQGLLKQFLLIRGMRIMTGSTHPVLYRRMDNFLRAHTGMAGVAKLGHFLREFEGLITLLRMRGDLSHMTGIARLRHGMDILPL